MKEIAFGNLGFSIVNSYKAMKTRIDNENEICLFNEFTDKAVVYKSFWGAEIEFAYGATYCSDANRIGRYHLRIIGGWRLLPRRREYIVECK